MKLSDFQFIKKENIINEKEFETLGIIDSVSTLTMCTFIENEKYLQNVKKNVTMLIATKEVYEKIEGIDIGIYITENPRMTFFELHNFISNNEEYKRESFETKIGKNCSISDLAVISEKNVIIEDNVKIEEFVIIRENTIIKENSIIRVGSIIGGEGFEFKKNNDEVFHVKHLGGVIIEKNAEVQYNCTIDKAVYPWDNTIIEEYVKIDNLNHVGHAAKIGKRTMLAASSVIGGRTIIGCDSWIGIGCTIRNGIRIGNNARCNMGSVVTKDVRDMESVTGNFAIPHELFMQNLKKIVKGEE